MARYSNKFGKHRTIGARKITTSSLKSEVDNGLIPIGGVVQLASNLTGAYSHPGGGVVDKGLMLCDGVSVIPVGSMASHTVPGLNNDVFLKGAAVAGVVGGSDNKVIPAAALPPHGHTVNITSVNAPHNHVASPNGHVNAPHSHTMYTFYPGAFSPTAFDRNDTAPGNAYSQVNVGTDNAPHNTPAGNVPAANAPHGHPITIGATGGGSPINTLDVTPDYISTIYAIRVI